MIKPEKNTSLQTKLCWNRFYVKEVHFNLKQKCCNLVAQNVFQEVKLEVGITVTKARHETSGNKLKNKTKHNKKNQPTTHKTPNYLAWENLGISRVLASVLCLVLVSSHWELSLTTQHLEKNIMLHQICKLIILFIYLHIVCLYLYLQFGKYDAVLESCLVYGSDYDLVRQQ